MDKTRLRVVAANKSNILVPSNFSNYDFALNPYVGCQFGCNYCYVRFFVKDAQSEWGDFVRRRDHLATRLPRELHKCAGARVVLGTMTDPYQPEERKARLTRQALQLLAAASPGPSKVGIFTRSPIVLDDLELISRLPRSRVHFSVTPFPKALMQKLERIPVSTSARFRTIRKLHDAGIRTHASVAPAIPHLSDAVTAEYCESLVACGVDEFFVDPMQTYSASYASLRDALASDPLWSQIDATMQNPAAFAAWKTAYRASWQKSWEAAGGTRTKTLAIWCDHTTRVWQDLMTGQDLDRRRYGDDAE